MDGHDYDVWYKGMVIANIKAADDEEAQKLARNIWGVEVTTKRV